MYTVPQCAGIIWLIIKLQCVALRSVCSAAAAFWVGKKPLTLRYAKHTSDCTNRWIFKMSKTKSQRTKKCTERKPAIYKVCTWLGIAETYFFYICATAPRARWHEKWRKRPSSALHTIKKSSKIPSTDTNIREKMSEEYCVPKIICCRCSSISLVFVPYTAGI